ncbi:hypothetical protein [Roseobacter weihaiensis]|uniref:hypothetical protein n=1 Tax=Roseobacter weihaiensis TaxID=2763262 RepID=UPI001D0A13BB|nr:hypothetical protein [Roseobacter sp. H9]
MMDIAVLSRLSTPVVARRFASAIDGHQTLWRWIFAGPAALVLALLAMASLPFALPAGRGGVNHLVLPVVLFPVLWTAFVILPVATRNLPRIAALYLGLAFFFLLLIVGAFLR